MRKSLSFYLFLIAFFTVFVPVFVLAVTVGPAKIEYRIDPGAIISDKLVLINDSGFKQTLYSDFEKFKEINGEKKFLPAEPTELANWVKLPKSITLEINEQKEIPFTIEVPKNAPPGGHFAVIWWGTAPPESKQVSIVTRAGILVYLRVSGDVKEFAEILKFGAAGGKFFWSKIPEDFVVLFKNSGNTYLKPKGEINVKNIFGSKRAVLAVNDVDIVLLPEGEQNLRIAKKFDKPPFAFGFYRAELSLNWGEKPESIQESVWLFVFPWKYAFGVIIVLIILFFGVKKGINKYNQWIVAKYSAK